MRVLDVEIVVYCGFGDRIVYEPATWMMYWMDVAPGWLTMRIAARGKYDGVSMDQGEALKIQADR